MVQLSLYLRCNFYRSQVCKHSKCIYFIVPEHLQGFSKGLIVDVASDKHILHISLFLKSY
jgi:hypothetical protein